MERREDLLRRLISFERPIAPLLLQLSEFGWDCQHELTQLTAQDTEKVIGRYLHGDATAAEIEAWENAVEGRDDLAVTELVKKVVYELANPILVGPLSNEKALFLVVSLRGSCNAS